MGVCFRKNIKWVGSVDLLSLPWQQADGASCQQYFFPVCTEVFNPCKSCRAEGEVMLEWDGPWILYKNSWFCHYEHFVYHCSCESRSEFSQPDLFTIQSLLIQKKTHFVCLVLPISKYFIVSEGVDSGMLVNCCCRSFGDWVDQDMPIPQLHENRHRELNCSSNGGDRAGGGWWKTWTSHHLFVSLLSINF